jgi:hypothetical protein
LATETKDDANLEPEVILVGARKPGVKIVSLDEPYGHAWFHLVVGPAANCHSKSSIGTATAKPDRFSVDMRTAKQGFSKGF